MIILSFIISYLCKDDQERGTISSPENVQLYMKNIIHISIFYEYKSNHSHNFM